MWRPIRTRFWPVRAQESFALAAIGFLTLGSYFSALQLRFDFNQIEVFVPGRFYPGVYFLVFFRLLSFYFFGASQDSLRYFSVSQAGTIGLATFIGTLLFSSSVLLIQSFGFPRSVLFIEFAIALVFYAGFRLLGRISFEYVPQLFFKGSASRAATVILGAGESAHLLVKLLKGERRAKYAPVAILDDSDRAKGSSVYGVPVVGVIDDLEAYLANHPDIQMVMLASHTLPKLRLERVLQACRSAQVKLFKQRTYEDIVFENLIDDSVISPEELLRRETVLEHGDEVKELIGDKIVLVTGGGGSIGSELCRQIASLYPAKLIILDSCEFNVFRLKREIEDFFPSINFRCCLADIRDQERLRQIFELERPELVFHAAALKHVPLVELNPMEGFSTNVVGTLNLLNISRQFKVRKFTLISSDKAVDPVNVMGATKRISELLVSDFVSPHERESELQAATVRFGNVINSSGSVIPIFREQILNGGPITVTHPDMERYFMSIQEAVRLVLAASTLGDRGEIFTLKLGKRVRIVELAEQLRSLYGREDIPIEFTGLRDGERLKEEMQSCRESAEETCLEGVERVIGLVSNKCSFVKEIERLRDYSGKVSDEVLRVRLKGLASQESSAACDPEVRSL